MKKIVLVLFCCIAVGMQAQFATAQKTRVGLGVGITSSSISFESVSSLLSPTSLYIPISTQGFRIEPEVGFWSMSESGDQHDESVSVFHAGTGLFSVKSVNSTNFYYGFRLAVDLISSNLEYGGNSNDDSVTNFNVGPALGGEHMFGDNFSLGGEVQLLYTSFGKSDGSSVDRSMIRSVALFFVRWHFGK